MKTFSGKQWHYDRLLYIYIFNGNEEDEDDDIGGPLVRNKSDWIPKPTKDKYLEESINT